MKALGQKVTYNTSPRDVSLLEAEPRITARKSYGYVKDTWDFGVDVWHCYETMFDLPESRMVGITKLVFPVTNKNIVESKSLKLYMFSLQECVFLTPKDFEDIVKQDISQAIDGDVKVKFFENNKRVYKDKENYTFHSPYLRSNCKITGQPDYGDLYINYTEGELEVEDLLDQLRNENHFHEECVEMIYQNLEPNFNQLAVYAKYTRRGGIDIWPYRSKGVIQHPKFTNVRKLTPKSFRG